jgi:hypothetical protein
MKARTLIEGATFEPDQVAVISHAFNLAWARLEPDVGTLGTARDDARLKLAKVVLDVARTNLTTAEQLADEALTIMFAAPRQL